MQTQATVPIPVTRSGIAVVDGYGVRIRVERGRLVISDGMGPLRREGRFARATHGIRRLVVLGHTGFISIEALRWLADVGISFIQLDADRRLLAASAGLGTREARLRRAQATSMGQPAGNLIARWLLRLKLEGQARVANLMDRHDISNAILAIIPALDRAASPADLMVPEAAAASLYWSGWLTMPVLWARHDGADCPPHWRAFGTRASPLTGNPRLAANPANAILNYLYALGEGEARLACLAVGLDPAIGVLHADQHGRDSLALDLLEAVRPTIDEWFLDLLMTRTFRTRDFIEARQGNCRVLPPLTHELAATIELWRRSLGPLAEALASKLAAAVDRPVALPTPLTQGRRSIGRDGVRRRRAVVAPVAATPIPRTCVACGGVVRRGRRYCAACRPDIEVFAASGTAALADARAVGRDPAHGGEVASIRGRKWRERRELQAEWEREHGRADPNVFREGILPRLVGLPTRRLVEATGLTRAYCGRIQKGDVVPHARWWNVLLAVATAGGGSRANRSRQLELGVRGSNPLRSGRN
jgi:CRISPR-associated endonuclease Cas1